MLDIGLGAAKSFKYKKENCQQSETQKKTKLPFF